MYVEEGTLHPVFLLFFPYGNVWFLKVFQNLQVAKVGWLLIRGSIHSVVTVLSCVDLDHVG